MRIVNPTDNEITVKIKGRFFTVPARGILTGISKEDAEYWKEYNHTFLTISEDRTEEGKALVCHNGQTLLIAEAALQAHLNHGDTEGAC